MFIDAEWLALGTAVVIAVAIIMAIIYWRQSSNKI